MALTSGDRLGPYEIQSALGAGGMGEVFRAKDTRLDRTVAIKVLAPAMAANPDFRERFEREARAVSALDHPNICALYDVGREPTTRGDGTPVDFLVMQFVAGETLAERLTRGPLKIREVLRLATEIASALDRAHRSNIVHRDLKPGNVMMTTTGAKLLDFGLARIMAPASVGMVSMPTVELTAEGTILGTFQYMAPEQLEGGEADARTDLFAFGALVYEAATGRKAFDGKSRASLIGSILRDDPLPISTVSGRPPSTSSGMTSTVVADADVLTMGLDRVVRRCLAKNAEDRWQTAADLLEALRWVGDGHAVERVAAPAAPPRRRLVERLAWAAAVVVAASFAAWGWLRPEPDAAVTRFAFTLPAGDLLTINGLALSPDQKTVVVTGSSGGTQMLFRRAIDQLEAVPIRGTEGAQYPFYSPDGKWIGFFTPNALKKVPADGGPATLITATGNRFGASWGPGETIVFASSTSPDLMRVPATGGTPQVLVTAKSFGGGGSLRWPAWSQDGRAVFVTIFSGTLGSTKIGVYVLATGESKVLMAGTQPLVIDDRMLLYGRASSIWQVPFDTKTFTLGSTPPVPIAQDAQINTGGLMPAAAAGTTFAFKPGSAGDTLTLFWARRDGTREPLIEMPQGYRAARVSPDGTRIAMHIVTDTEGGEREASIWVYTIKTKTLDRVTFGQGRYTDPVWTSDGRLIYGGTDDPDGVRNLYWTRADGSGVPERLTTSTKDQTPRALSRQGVLMYMERDGQGSWDLHSLSVTGDRKPVPFVQTPLVNEANPAFSPDGQFVAYLSNEAGQNEIYVRPLTGPGKWKVSQGGGQDPEWSTDGKELYFFAQQNVVTVPVATSGSTFAMTAVPRALFPFQRQVGFPMAVHPIDGRFLLLDRPERDVAHIVVTQNAFHQTKP